MEQEDEENTTIDGSLSAPGNCVRYQMQGELINECGVNWDFQVLYSGAEAWLTGQDSTWAG